jgi:hypothetical protein
LPVRSGSVDSQKQSEKVTGIVQPTWSKSLITDSPSDTLALAKLALKLLERRLVKSHTTVVIPFDDRVIFVNLPNRAEFSRRYSEVAHTLDAISGIQFLASAGRFDKRGLLGTV